jgi:hypothetical protein
MQLSGPKTILTDHGQLKNVRWDTFRNCHGLLAA